MSALFFTLIISLSYLAGSICSAVIVSRMFSLPDPRSTGSNNPGATNVLRLAGKKYAVIVLLADALKGFLPILIAKILGVGLMTMSFACLAAVIGHMFPFFFDFKGGKGVATALGALLGLNFILGILVIGTWLLVAYFSRYSSLASMISIILAPFFAFCLFGQFSVIPGLLLMSLFILYKHKNNITRLIDKEEPKIQFKGSK